MVGDEYLELSVEYPMTEEYKWVYRFDRVQKGWRLTCRSRSICGRTTRCVFNLDEKWTHNLFERLARIKLHVRPPTAFGMHDDGAENSLTLASPLGSVKIRWFDGTMLNESFEEMVEEIIAIASTLVDLHRANAGRKVRLIQSCSVQFGSPWVAYERKAVLDIDVGMELVLRPSALNGGSVVTLYNAEGVRVGCLMHPDVEQICRLLEQGHDLKAIVGEYSEDVHQEEKLRVQKMNVLIVDLSR